MLKKYHTLAAASLISIGAYALPASTASAGALPYVQQSTAQTSYGDNPLLQKAGHQGDRRFDRRRGHGKWKHGKWKHGKWRGHHRHRHHRHGFGHHLGFFAAPLIIGGGYYGGYDGGDHVSYCFSRYPNSYDPGDNTWVSYNGRVYECRSPYRYY